MRSILTMITALSLIAAAASAAAGPTPAVDDHHPKCDVNQSDSVADFSMHVTDLRLPDGQPVWSELRRFGINTIVRYYDWNPESQACKTLFNDEASEIIRNKFSIAVVFQHFNGDPETFIDPTRGEKDANRSLDLAEHNGQPPGSTIYFGVDGPDQVIRDVVLEYRISHGKAMTPDRRAMLLRKPTKDQPNKHYDPALVRHYERFLAYRTQAFGSDIKGVSEESLLPYIGKYFQKIGETFKTRGNGTPRYRVGAYGSGLVCNYLISVAKVIDSDRCWLAQSKGWPGYDKFEAAPGPRWALRQRNPTYCNDWKNVREGVGGSEVPGFDFNTVNPAKPDFGQWPEQLESTETMERPVKCPPLN
jgi:Rv2525c-like, glycoside hydrolase-like domain